MIVGREQRTRAKAWGVMDIFDDRPGDGEPIIGTRSASDFIQNEKRARRCVIQDIRRLDHLDHECRKSGVDFVLRDYEIGRASCRERV